VIHFLSDSYRDVAEVWLGLSIIYGVWRRRKHQAR
jgi:hypothetical protein